LAGVAAAQHSRLGETVEALSTSGGAATALALGDTLTLEFEAWRSRTVRCATGFC
jgi:hypothetical protein